jgi:CO dehydrogenase maturation factor
MRVAFVGKGGSGKSTAVGTIARSLAAAGEPTLVLDSDVMPGLAGALGTDPTEAGIPEEATVPGEPGGQRFRLRDGLTADDAVEAFASRGPDGVRLLQLGKLRDEGPWTLGPSRSAFHQIARELAEQDDRHLIGDLPGGTRQPFFGWGAYADTLVVVVEPTVKSFVTARRLRRLGDVDGGPRLVVLANKVTTAGDEDRIAAETGLEVLGAVPHDSAVQDADRAGEALVDHAPDAPATAALRSFVAALREVQR